MNRALAIVSLALVSLGLFVGAGVGSGAVWWALAGGQAAASFDDDQPPGAPAIPGAETEPEGDAPFDGIGFGSIGPINITQTAQEAIDALGSGQTNTVDNDQCTVFLLGLAGDGPRTYGLAESEGAYGALDTVTLQAGWNGEDSVYGEDLDLPRTREGITLGATLDELLAAYPDQLEVRPHTYSEFGKYVDLKGPENTGIMFATNDDGRVDYISTGRYPQVQYIEGCA